MKNLLSTCLVASLGFVCTQNASATVFPILTLTEVSSSTLNWSWSNGGPSGTLPANGGPDVWQALTITGPTLTTSDSLSGAWVEPEDPLNPLDVNTVFVSYNNSSWTLSVFSEDTGDAFNNGQQVSSTFDRFAVIFNDNGDRVPDSGSTLLLLTLGLVGVGLLQVKSKARPLSVCG
jgi:hypothetical protein